MQSPPAPPFTPDRLARGLLFGGLAVGAALRLWAAFSDDGIFWPDEVYQSLEPAHKLVFGYGLIPWEFIDGARNWALPGFIAFLMKLSVIFGLDTPNGYLGVIHVAFVAIAVGSAYGVYRLARAYGAAELPSAVAALALMLCAPAIYFSHRAMAENASALPVVLGLWLLLERDATRKRRLIGASLLGVAVLLRLQCGLFCVGALIILLARKQRRPALEALGVLTLWAFVFGALDAFTWHDAPGAKFGGWFHSALKYLQFNLVENGGSHWGTSPPQFYAKVLFSSMPGLAVCLVVGLLLGLRRAAGLVVLGLLFLVAHSAIAHKELRFVMPVLPLLFAAAAVGFNELKQKPQWAALAALVVCAGVSALHHRALTFGDLGAYPERAGTSAWDDYGPVNRLMKIASTHADVCGLRIDAAHLAWTGGSSYLHRKAPLYMPGTPVEYRHFNYAIVHPGSGAEVIAAEAGLELVRIPIPCDPDPGYSWRLP
jgi:hypothetical protein